MLFVDFILNEQDSNATFKSHCMFWKTGSAWIRPWANFKARKIKIDVNHVDHSSCT